ncbi:hypothetical protein GCM10019059_43690 [Camelimonas fluminis]|nr:hypothetical protein GCM10019059_43690 [Camelimonas fluminis]
MLKNVDAPAFTAAEINEMVSGLIVDSFAGGGGASTGIEWALHRSPDFAINHDAEALCMAVSTARCAPGSRLDVEAADINAAMPKRGPTRSETATSAAILRQFGNSIASSIVDPLGTTTCHGGGKSARRPR